MQPPNPALSRLGFSSNDRVVILHADDIGMCRSTLAAYQDLLEFGLVSSAAAIATSSWFPATAAFCRAHPEVDMGVHLTLTSEWQSYRWGPLASRDPATGLLDDEGYVHATSEAGQERGEPAGGHRRAGNQLRPPGEIRPQFRES